MNLFKDEATCFNCHKSIDLSVGAKIARNEECPHCYASMHSCKMCKFYDKNSYNECKETNADRIVEKEKSNFCDYFEFLGSHNRNDSNTLDAANALFKN